MRIAVILLLLCILFPLNTLSEDYTKMGLPDGATARLGKGPISDIAYSPDGTRLAVAGSIGIWLYDTATLKEVALLISHTGPVESAALSPDGSVLASGSDDGTVLLWDFSHFAAENCTVRA